MTDKEIMQMALDALELVTDLTNHDDEVYAAIEALRARLTQPEPEPVAWISAEETWLVPKLVISDTPKDGYKPAYTAPPQREWQGLTDEEIKHVNEKTRSIFVYARAIEAKLKEKNT